MSLGFTEKIRYTKEQLLKDKPEKLDGMDFLHDDGSDDSHIDINGVKVYATHYEIVYGESYIILNFIDCNEEIVASLSAFRDIIVMNGAIYSESAMENALGWMK